jgi:hypothetical protein
LTKVEEVFGRDAPQMREDRAGHIVKCGGFLTTGADGTLRAEAALHSRATTGCPPPDSIE